MKKYIISSLLVFFSAPMFVFAEQVKVGVIDYPPHAIVKGRVASGPAVEYITKVLKSAGMDPVFTGYPSRRAMSEFDSGNIDILLPINNNVDKGNKLSRSLFHVTPGLCFRKDNFISILSANHRFKGMKIGFSDGTKVLSDLTSSGANMTAIKGKDNLTRGIKMLKAGRYDAIYHPSPINIYNQQSEDYDSVACSYFYGHSDKVFVTTSDAAKAKYKSIDEAFVKNLSDKSYEFYFAENK